MSRVQPNSRVLWLLLPVAVCIFALVLWAPAVIAVPLGVTAFLTTGFSTKLFGQLAARKPFLSALLGGVAGVAGLYLSAVAVLVVINLGSPYFDARVTSHWEELFGWPLFMLGSLPAALRAFVVLGSALVGVAVSSATRPKRSRKV